MPTLSMSAFGGKADIPNSLPYVVSMAGHEHLEEPVELPAEGLPMRLSCLRIFVGIDEKS
jgi:hypothetical protein